MILFFSEDIDYSIIETKQILLQNWIKNVITIENKHLDNDNDLNIIVCSDIYLLELNKQYLNKETLTDVIAFPNTENENYIAGDIFISYDRIKENAKLYANNSFEEELYRVIIHGILHFLGYVDKTKEDRNNMHNLEDKYLNLLLNS